MEFSWGPAEMTSLLRGRTRKTIKRARPAFDWRMLIRFQMFWNGTNESGEGFWWYQHKSFWYAIEFSWLNRWGWFGRLWCDFKNRNWVNSLGHRWLFGLMDQWDWPLLRWKKGTNDLTIRWYHRDSLVVWIFECRLSNFRREPCPLKSKAYRHR